MLRRSLTAASLLLILQAAAYAADKTTQQSITLPSGPLPFTATVETEKLTTPDGKPAAEIVTTAFLHEDPNRPAGDAPITFAFSSSERR